MRVCSLQKKSEGYLGTPRGHTSVRIDTRMEDVGIRRHFFLDKKNAIWIWTLRMTRRSSGAMVTKTSAGDGGSVSSGC